MRFLNWVHHVFKIHKQSRDKRSLFLEIRSRCHACNMISGTNGLWDIDTLGAKLEYIASNSHKIWVHSYTSYSKLI
jgi:hypothetical protein